MTRSSFSGRSDMIEKYNTNRHLYIKSYDSKGNTEMIAATKDCLKKSNNYKQEPISFEELHYQVLQKQIQLENLRTSNIPNSSSSSSSSAAAAASSSFFSNSLYNDSDPGQLTQETKKATDLVDDLIYGQGKQQGENNKEEDEEEEEPLSFTPHNIQRYHTDENATGPPPQRKLTKMDLSRQESSGSLFEEHVDTFMNDHHNSDDEDLDYAMQQEAEKAKHIPLKRTRPY